MNEIKENIVILSKDIYDLMKQHEKEIENQIELLKKEYTIFEKYFWDNLYQNNNYYFNDMHELNIKDYSYRELVSKTLEIGLTDIEYINKKLGEYKTKETVKGEENGERD